jgi:hypothetical protein
MSAINDLNKKHAEAWVEYGRALDLVSDAETLLDTICESDLFDQEVPILARILIEKMDEGIKLRKAYMESLRVKKNIILDAMEAR